MHELSHLPLKIRARYGNLAQDFDRRPPEDETHTSFGWPLLHIKTLLPRRRFGRPKKAVNPA